MSSVGSGRYKCQIQIAHINSKAQDVKTCVRPTRLVSTETDFVFLTETEVVFYLSNSTIDNTSDCDFSFKNAELLLLVCGTDK